MSFFPQIITPHNRKLVPNQFPVDEREAGYRLAIIGEAPGEYEEDLGLPFVGPSGNFLNMILDDVGIDRAKCFVGNLCQYRPRGNDINNFDWNGTEIQHGIKQLRLDLDTYSPNLVLALGGSALHFLKEGNIEPRRKSGKHDYPNKITSWRGSLFSSRVVARKCLSSLHPAGVLREYSGFPLLKFDLTRAAAESRTPSLNLPARELVTNLGCQSLIELIDHWPAGTPCSVDIEGGLPDRCVNDGVRKDSKKRRHIGWRCVSLSDSPSRGYVIAWWKFNEWEQAALTKAFAHLMWREDVPKVLQNSLYDKFVLAYGYGIIVRNVRDDVMLKGWEVYSELRKGLSTQASIWTREPHWKDDEMYESTGDALAVGCAKDTTVTLEISEAQDSYFEGNSQDNPSASRRLAQSHYFKNLEMLNPLLYMELRGINYDKENVAKELSRARSEIAEVAARLNATAGSELRGDKGSLSSDRLAYCLYQLPNRTTKSGKAKAVIEWKNKAYPPQYQKEAGKKTDKVTTDVEAILNLRRKLAGDAFLDDILTHRHLEGIIETLSIKPDADGRVRCGYNVVGTETGRLTCYTSPTGAGANLQTITKKLRFNYIADPGYDFFQCDLAGADAWTVAAHCLRLGDSTMMDDYKAGLKPAKLIALLHVLGPQINNLDRDSLLWWSQARKKETDEKLPFDLITDTMGGPGIYECTKQVGHGSNYLMGIPTMQTLVMKKSFKETGIALYLDHQMASAFQSSYFLRYSGLRTWHAYSESALRATGRLTSAGGHTRVFFGRRYGKDIQETLKEWLAEEPQANTTYATNLAMLALWNDPANRVGSYVGSGSHEYLRLAEQHLDREALAYLVNRQDYGALYIEPLHSVHDALCGQWPTVIRPFGKMKMKTYFNNELEIAGQSIVIPFDGGWGPSWGDCKNKI